MQLISKTDSRANYEVYSSSVNCLSRMSGDMQIDDVTSGTMASPNVI